MDTHENIAVDMGYHISQVFTSAKICLKDCPRPRYPATFSYIHSDSSPVYLTSLLRFQHRA